jgi:pimeloyl-ACP methyl ester carboxylesterase
VSTAPGQRLPDPVDDVVQLPGGRPRLAVRRTDPAGPADAGGAAAPFLLVHGLASNARLWDGVARRLAAAGHRVVAVDQRGHGRSEEPDGGYDTDTCADDLAALVDVLALDRPVVAGQSWGGSVVLSLAARHPGAAGAVCCVDGGWNRLADRFDSFDACWAVLAPPSFDGARWADVQARFRTWMSPAAGWPPEAAEAGLANLVATPDGGVRARLAREHHRDILRSLYEGDPRAWYPRIDVPVLLCPANGPQPAPGEGEWSASGRAAVLEAVAQLPRGAVRWYPGAHHDLHAQRPDELAADLLALAGQAALGAGEAGSRT